jgi:hypothetical protein
MNKRSLAVGLILAFVLGGAACARDQSPDLSSESTTAPETGAQADSSKKPEGTASLLQSGSSATDGGTGDAGEGGEASSRASGGLGAAGPVPPAQPAALPNIPPATSKVIKNASLEIRVRKGSFEREFGRATAVAEQFGGFVSNSSVTETDRNISSGTLTVRVPSNQFQAALRRFQGLGKVTNEEQSGQDVTKEFVDLEARLRHAKTEEAFFLRLLDQSRSISDMIQVQSQLSAVQLRIEEIQGQLNYLNDQTSFSTITARIYEPGAPAGGRPVGLTRAWQEATQAFQSVLAGFVVAMGWLAPFALFGLVAYVVYRVVRRSRVRTVAGGGDSPAS